MASGHSRLWEDLVGESQDGSPDLEGMVAYAIYKQNKRSWYRQFEQQNGRPPNGDEVVNYVRSITPEDRQRYHREAVDHISDYTGYVVEAARPGIEEAAVDRSILGEVRRQNSFWRNLGVNLLASAALAIILFLIGVVFLAPSPQELGRHWNAITRPAP